MLHADEPGAELEVRFEGRAIGAYVVAGPDAGILELSVDRGPFKKINLFHRFSKGLHYPRTVMFASDLKPGPHKVHVRLASGKNKTTPGNAARVIQFVAN